jgi:phosphatidylserine decarboxylase
MKINKEGYWITVKSFFFHAALAAGALWLLKSCAGPLWPMWIIGTAMLVLFLLTVVFFRDPRREYLSDDGLVFAPADGRIVVIEEVVETEYLGEKRIQISVFMSITDVHKNWYPAGGEIVYRKHHQGKHLVAWHPTSSEHNERMTVAIDTGKGKIVFRQIAGYVARRIVSYAVEGRRVKQNTPCGFIKFGSRVDVFLPLDSEILVSPDQKVVGSITPLARLKTIDN